MDGNCAYSEYTTVDSRRRVLLPLKGACGQRLLTLKTIVAWNVYIVSRNWRGPLEQPKQWETKNLEEFVDEIRTLVLCAFKITWLKHTFLIWVLFLKVLAGRSVCCNIDKEWTHFPDEEQIATLPVLDIMTVTRLPVCLSNCGLWGLPTVTMSLRSCWNELQISLFFFFFFFIAFLFRRMLSKVRTRRTVWNAPKQHF